MRLLACLAAALAVRCARADNSTWTDDEGCSAPPDAGPWGALLEEWALSAPAHSDRHGRIMALPPAQGYYVVDRVDRPPPPPPAPHYAGPFPYDEWRAPPPPPDTKIVNRPPYKDKFKPSPSYNSPPASQLIPAHHPPPPPPSYRPDGPGGHGGPGSSGGPASHGGHGGSGGPGSHGGPGGPGGHGGPGGPGSHGGPGGYGGQNGPGSPGSSGGPGSHGGHGSPGGYGGQGSPGSHGGFGGPGGAADRIGEVAAPPPRKQVSETHLYLLSAIEKLVWRVDLMEKRLRKMEESMHYLVAGADKQPEPCVTNFTRVGSACYQYSGEPADWKTANLACRKLRANLLELETDAERRDVIAAMLADKRLRGMDVWTGGLNPGLLWIWSHSARPVAGEGGGAGNATLAVLGEGRCLALVHDPALNTYVYRGQDCALRHRYICEKEEDKMKLSNEIERVARALKSTGKRSAKILWADDHN